MPKIGLKLRELIQLNETMSPAQIAEYLTSQGKPITRQGICSRFKEAGYKPTRHYRVWIGQIVELRKKMETYNKIAKETGSSTSTVLRRKRQSGVGKISRQFTPPNEAETFARLRVGGGNMSQESMAKEFNVHVSTLIRWINRYRTRINGNNDT